MNILLVLLILIPVFFLIFAIGLVAGIIAVYQLKEEQEHERD